MIGVINNNNFIAMENIQIKRKTHICEDNDLINQTYIRIPKGSNLKIEELIDVTNRE